MKVEIKVPTLGESVSQATISAILVPSGSVAESGQEILELETDKVNQVLYAPGKGSCVFTVTVGDTVNIGDVIGYIDTEAVSKPSSVEKKEEKQQKVEPSMPLEGARQTAQQFVDKLQKPVEKPIVSPPVAPPPVMEVKKTQGATSRQRMSGLRKTIASRLVEAKNKTAMLTTFNEVDMSAILEIRNREKDNFLEKYGVKLGFMSFFVKASVSALKAFPLVNSMIEGEEIVTFQSYDIGVAVSTDKGLFVPVIRGCDTLSFSDVEKAIGLYAKKAREGGIAVSDLQGGSFTITNGGVFGSLLSTPILNPPQSAILGMHATVKRAVVVDDAVVIRPMMYLALSYDHRIIDGKEAVQFLVHIKESLEDPARLLLDI